MVSFFPVISIKSSGIISFISIPFLYFMGLGYFSFVHSSKKKKYIYILLFWASLYHNIINYYNIYAGSLWVQAQQSQQYSSKDTAQNNFDIIKYKFDSSAY